MHVCLLFGPTLLAEVTDDIPNDFQPYPGYESPDGKVAKGTQEELLVWIHSNDKDLCWEAQFNFRNAVAGHMTVARETPTFIYRNSLDLTGFIDGTGNPEPEDQYDRGIVPEGQPGAGGSFCIAQRWVHDLGYFNGLSLEDQENTFGRTKADSTRLSVQVPTSHLSHVELREGATADESTPKRGEMVRRSTPYAFHDGTVGLYFMGFCREQAPTARADGSDLRQQRARARRAHRLLDAGVRARSTSHRRSRPSRRSWPRPPRARRARPRAVTNSSGNQEVQRAIAGGPCTMPCGVFSQCAGLNASCHNARHAAIECRVQ